MRHSGKKPGAVLTILSGGQTGVDRGALDAALCMGIRCGGWCPADRGAEDGPIPDIYPLWPLARGGYAERTRRNVVSSDGTLILCFGSPSGGTLLTLEQCRSVGKPLLLMDGEETAPEEAAVEVERFVARARIRLLNVAGPRATEDERGYGYAFRVVKEFLALSGSVEQPRSEPSSSRPGGDC